MKRTLKIFRLSDAFDAYSTVWGGQKLLHNDAQQMAGAWLEANNITIEKSKLQVLHQRDLLRMEMMIAIVADISDEEWFMLKLRLVDA